MHVHMYIMDIYVYPYILLLVTNSMAELNNTTRINTTIDSGLEEEFRELAFKTFGYKKGSIQNGLEDAIYDWIRKQKKRK